ncbi:MAG: enoyl-CoA hydratase [Pseudomonadales bacterium]
MAQSETKTATEIELVTISIDDGIALVTLNRPKALNALSSALRNAIIAAFEQLATDSSVQVIILTGAGRAFTVGLDLKELGGEQPADATPVAKNLLAVLAAVPQPIIGAINGFAITGGFELALMCDFLIAGESAKFADTHARVGVVPGWGLSQRLPRLIGINRAKELSLTGNYLDAETAAAWGLVNRVVPDSELLATCRSLATDIASTDPATRLEIKRIMDAGWETGLGEGLTIEAQASAAHGKRQRPEEAVAARRADIQNRGRSQSS